MARAPQYLETPLDAKPLDRAAKAAKNALLTCALAFGRAGGGEQEVLFAVARSYTAVARARYGDERLASDIIEVDDGQVLRSLLEKAEEKLCAASKALPHFSRRAVRRLLGAARAYTEAWELDRSWAVRVALRRDTSRRNRAERAHAPSSSHRPYSTASFLRSRHVIAQCRHSCRSSRP